MEALFTTDGIISLISLTFMEIILGIDNVVFIAIIAGKLPEKLQDRARNWGLILALVPRIILLLFISWLAGLESDLFNIEIFGHSVEMTQKGLILLLGGLFLLYNSTSEIHGKLEGGGHGKVKTKEMTFVNALVQIVLLNIVFSFDSILTAIGLVDQVLIMIIAIVIALGVTLIFAKGISDFVEKHPTVKMLALSFLLLIGFLLVTESLVFDGEEVHVPKGYIYFAMAFSLFVEILNLRMRKNSDPVKLKKPYEA